MKKIFKKYYVEILSMLIPVIILLISCFINKTFPFGNNILAKYDGYYQYPGFTTYYKSALLGQNSLFYSFKGLLGYNFFSTSIYYMFNFSNLLCVFFNRSNIIEYYSILVFLRISLCGLTMSKYLKYKFKDKNNIYLIIFSVAYALMGYNICYFYNYMYFDTVVLFPLTIIGLEKLINEGKKGMYILLLTLSIIANFYIGYMVCIFCLLYFIYNYILLKKKNKKIIKDFIFSSLLVGVMCVFILLPAAYDLAQGKASLYSDPEQTDYFSFNTNFLNIFYKSLPGTMTNYDVKYGTVNIYVSVLTMILAIKYFFNKSISKKEKIVTLSFIAFFLLSISFNLIDYSWHLFQRPIWYPNRYIFVFSFFLLTIAYKSVKYNNDTKTNTLTKIIIIVGFILLTVYPAIYAVFYQRVIKIIAYVLGILLLIQYVCFSEKKEAKILICGLFFLELTLNSILTLNELSSAKTMKQYLFENKIFEQTIASIKDNEKSNDFYRTELQTSIVYNNGSMYDYNGISFFSSLRNGKIMHFFKDYFDYIVKDDSNMVFDNNNPYLSSILGVKYMSGSDFEDYYESIKNESIYLYKNNDALSLGFMVNKNSLDHEFILYDKNYNTNEIVNTMLGTKKDIYYLIDDIKYVNCERKIVDGISKVVQSDLDNSYVLVKGIAGSDGFIIPDKDYKYYVQPEIKINGKESNDYYFNRQMPMFLNKGDKYEIKFKTRNASYDATYIELYFYNAKYYKEFVNTMKENELKITNYKNDSNIEGKITSTKGKSLLFTSIPYDKGWKIYVDNKKVDYKVCYDAFICLSLEEGNHNIKFKYTPPYLLIGTIISSIGLIITIIYVKRK